MAWRLWYGITWPAGVATLVLGGALLQYFWPPQRWLLVKLGLVLGLMAYHLGCHWLHGRLQDDSPPWSSRSLRIYNEVATLFLVAIVFAVTGVTRAGAMVLDIQNGYFDRLMTTPVSRRALLLGHMVADFVLVVALSGR